MGIEVVDSQLNDLFKLLPLLIRQRVAGRRNDFGQLYQGAENIGRVEVQLVGKVCQSPVIGFSQVGVDTYGFGIAGLFQTNGTVQ